jgi:hypothetical protein
MNGKYFLDNIGPFLFTALMCVEIVTCVAQEPRGIEAGYQETIAELEAIDVGIRRWRDALNLKCTFQFRQGLANSIDDAVNGLYPNGWDEATCHFVKLGDAVVHDFRIKGDSDFDPKTNTSTFSSFYLASSKDIEAFSARIGTANPIMFSNRTNQREHEFIHRQAGSTNTSPFVVTGANRGALFQPFIDSNLSTFTAIRGQGQLMVSCKPIGGAQAITYTIDIAGLFPMLDSIKRDDGNATTVVSSFVQLKNGCYFPGRTVTVLGPVVPIGSQKQKWVSRIWELDNSSVCEPTRDDFVIDPNVELFGLRAEKKTLPLNFLDIAVEWIDEGNAGPSPTEALDIQFVRNEEISVNNADAVSSVDWNSRFIWLGIFVIVFGGFMFFAARNLARK